MAMADAAPPPPSSTEANARVNPKTVQRAVNSLLKWRNSKSQTQKPQLLDDDEFVYLIGTLKKIPAKGRINAYKIPLPHSLHSPESSEFCLFIDDRSKSGLTKADAMKKIKSDEIPISKVLKLSKLKSDYKPFEAKRKLCDSYDMFFADKRVVPLLPRLLGKHFFKKRKIPVPIDLKHKNWKEQTEKACGSAMLFLRTGTCSVVRVAKASMGAVEIAENAMATINGIAEIVPRKWGNVRSFHLKLLESVALPVYQALPDIKLKIEGIKEEVEEEEKEDGDKRVGKDEKVAEEKKKKKKGRIHEVRYMDVNDGVSSEGEDELGGNDSEDNAKGEESENEELGSSELVGKKRKKGEVAADEKPSKKSAKAKDKDGVKRKRDGIAKKTDENALRVKAVKSGIKGKKESVGKLKSAGTKLKVKKSKYWTD